MDLMSVRGVINPLPKSQMPFLYVFSMHQSPGYALEHSGAVGPE